MIEKKKVICKGCGKVHKFDDLSHFAESYSDEFFPAIWKEGKNDLKNMSKKEVAEQMYFLGVKHFMEEVHRSMQEMKKELKSEIID